MSIHQGIEQSHPTSTTPITSHTALQTPSSIIADTDPSQHSASTHPSASSADVVETMFDDFGPIDPLLGMEDAFGDIGSEPFPSANPGPARTAPGWNTGGGEQNTDADVQSTISSRPLNKNLDADQVNQVDPFDGSGVQREKVGGRARLVRHKHKRSELEDGHDETKQEGGEDLPDYSKTQAQDARKDTEVKHSPPSGGKMTQEEDDKAEEDFDLREPVRPGTLTNGANIQVARFDSRKELVDKWDAIQAEMVPELKSELLDAALTEVRMGRRVPREQVCGSLSFLARLTPQLDHDLLRGPPLPPRSFQS